MKGLWIAFWLGLLAAPLPAQVHLGGELSTEQRYQVQAGSGRWTWNENRLQVHLDAHPAENLHLYAELRLRALGFPGVHTLQDLQGPHKDSVFPWSLEVREAYVDLYDFGLAGLDLRLGRQMIVWGTADRINPTSNLSPYDLEDFLDFGAKLGVNALRAIYNRDPWALELDVVPVFTPATLPPPAWASGFMGLAVPPELLISTVTLPEPTARNTQWGVKLSTTLAGWDGSVSYYQGFDGLPLPDTLALPFRQGPVRVHLRYPGLQVLGADLAGALGSVGVWAEAALFVPEDFAQTWILSGMPRSNTVLSSHRPYLRAVVGGDYTFPGQVYLNAQYLRGFLHERGPDSLHDYLVLRLEKKEWNDALTLAPLGLMVTVGQWEDPANHYGLAWIPEVRYQPMDNLELRLGAMVLHGQGENLFARLKDQDEVYLRVTVSW